MSGTRRSERISKQKCKIENNNKLCDLTGDDDSDLYKRRKTQKTGKDSAFVKDDGIDYNGNDPLISDLFDEDLLPSEIKTKSGVEQLKRSYIYIISKKIDGRTFIKIGVSNTTRLRFVTLQNALIPGLENIGFKLHYLLFYKNESSETSNTYAESIEQELHKILRKSEQYKNLVIHFPSNKPSEWYLPDSDKYREFFDFVLDFISMQTPNPETGYHFFVENNKNTREFKTKFLRVSTRQEILQYRKDHSKKKLAADIEATKQEKAKQQKDIFKKGTKAYFMEKLVNSPTNVLDNKYKVADVMYHKGKTDSIRTHGNYYVRIAKSSNSKVNKKRDLRKLKSYIQLSYSEQIGEETYYWTHIFNLLVKMKEIGSLEKVGLQSNYNYYFAQPLLDAKRLISSFSNKDVTLKKTQVNWIIGRHARDNKGDLYVATSLSTTNTGRINGVMFSPVNPENMLRIEGSKEVKANVIIAISLVIEYHEENPLPSYAIDEEYQEEPSTKYQIYDFILLDANYFKNFETQEPIQDTFIGIIMQNYDKFDKDSGTYKNYYDILFEDEMWRLETDSVDAKSKKLVNPVQKARFVAKLKNDGKLISNILKELGINTTLTRINTRSTRKAQQAKPGTKAKPKPGATRRSARLQKGKKNTTMKLRSDNK